MGLRSPAEYVESLRDGRVARRLNLVVALQACGGLTAQRFMMNRTHDIAAAKASALRAAGAV